MLYIQDNMGSKFGNSGFLSDQTNVSGEVKAKAKSKAIILSDSDTFSSCIVLDEGGSTMRLFEDVNKVGSIVLFILSIILFGGAISNTVISSIGGIILGTLSITSSVLFWIYSMKVERGC